MTETVHIGGPVPADLAQAFREIAERHDRSVAAELRRVLKEHVDKHQAPEEATA